MGSTGYRYAGDVSYRSGDVILEIGSGESTPYLASLGPLVVAIDADRGTYRGLVKMTNVEAHHGLGEDVLKHWDRSIGFAWLDGHDWPYSGAPEGFYDRQRAGYESRGQAYSQEASQQSHLTLATLIVNYARVIGFDDTWRTHVYRPGDDQCVETVPPATMPAPVEALNEPMKIDEPICGLSVNHPHHDYPERGWNGKGGTAIPYLLERGFAVVKYELNLVILERVDRE
jgi:hypothetical protein